MLSIMAHFFPIFIGLQIINKKYKLNKTELFNNYFILCILSNIINYICINMLTNHEILYFTVSFFVKFSLLNIVVTILIAVLYILIRENINVNIYIKKKKNEKK